MATFLLKTEPSEFSFDDLRSDADSTWDGVTNPQALIYLRAVSKGDELLIYHTGSEKAVVGLARATSGAFEDPKNPGLTPDGLPKYAVVRVRAVKRASSPVTLGVIKADKRFAEFLLVKNARLSVMPVSPVLGRVLREMAGLA